MCGRFDCHSAPTVIAKVFKIDHFAVTDYKPSYNIAPTRDIVIVRDDGKRHLMQCRWGFVPSWAKDTRDGFKMINARAESVAVKPAFKDAFRNLRCLVIADGFYEWIAEGRVKRPVYIRLKSHEPFGMAGLYSTWRSPEGQDICTCTIITTDANDLLRPIHGRMPVIIPKEQEDFWLNPSITDKDKLLRILMPYPSAGMECYEVFAAVNKPDFDAPEAILPCEKNMHLL